MTTDAPPRGSLPEVVRQFLYDLQSKFDISLSLWSCDAGERAVCLYAEGQETAGTYPAALRRLDSPDGDELELEVRGDPTLAEPLASTIATGLEKLFDLGQDPHERGSRADAPEAARLRRFALAYLTRARREAAALRPVSLDPQTLERLKALGYVR